MAKFSPNALQRRLEKGKDGAPSQAGTPVGPKGGKKQLAPQKGKASSMFTKNPQAGKFTKALQNRPKPR